MIKLGISYFFYWMGYLSYYIAHYQWGVNLYMWAIKKSVKFDTYNRVWKKPKL